MASNFVKRRNEKGPAVSLKENGVYHVPTHPKDRLRKMDNYILYIVSVGAIFPGLEEMYDVVNHCRLVNDFAYPKGLDGEPIEDGIDTPAELGKYFFSSDGTNFRNIVLNDYIFRFTNIIVTINRNSDNTNFQIYKSIEIDGRSYKQ